MGAALQLSSGPTAVFVRGAGAPEVAAWPSAARLPFPFYFYLFIHSFL